MKQKYNVLSPDGFTIHHSDTYDTVEEAKIALYEWMERYKTQGYYSSVNGRIPLNELENNCKIIELKR
jgi:hypothetical protein